MSRIPVVLLGLACGCCTPAPVVTPTPPATSAGDAEAAAMFDQAENAAAGRDLGQARSLYREVAARDGVEPRRRDRAAIRAAALEWHVFADADAARALLASVRDDSSEASAAWSERARMETELARDFAAARAAARHSCRLARTLTDRETASIRAAEAAVEQARLARRDGTPPPDRETLRSAIDDLRSIAAAAGPVIESSRLLLNAALLLGDQAVALQAWRWYHADAAANVPAAFGDRRALGLALAAARLFPEAELVLGEAGAAGPGTAADDDVRCVLVYAAALRRIDALGRAHYRAVGRGVADDRGFQDALAVESQNLWNELAWPRDRPEYSAAAFQQELGRRFGAVISLGKTDGVFCLLFGHEVIDEQRVVEQYGHSANLRFIALDGMVSGGYLAWITHDRSGTGGWIGSDAIYQIRTMYADGPVRRWRRLTDPELRSQRDQEIEAETRRDAERVVDSPICHLRGLELRLERQAAEALRAQLLALGLAGDALRDAFLERSRADEFAASIWAHEGRHAIDKKVFGIEDSAELEFCAKTSEIALALSPRAALRPVLSPVDGQGAHGQANRRLLAGVVAWMRTHARELDGLDAAAPLLPQLDRLTDDQLRAAFQSMDPLAQ